VVNISELKIFSNRPAYLRPIDSFRKQINMTIIEIPTTLETSAHNVEGGAGFLAGTVHKLSLKIRI
jgi:hypothetical protein